MRYATVCLCAAASLAAVCSNDGCLYRIDDGFVLDNVWFNRKARDPPSALRQRLCNTTSWMAVHGCIEQCPVAFEVLSPPELAGLRLCLKDNEFEGGGEADRLSTDHPLIGRELELAAATNGRDACSAERLSGVGGKVALLPRGGCEDAQVSALAGSSGALASVIVNSGVETGHAAAWFQSSSLHGSVPSGGVNLTMMVSQALGGPVLAMIEGGTAVRGRFVMECDREPPLLTEADITGAWDGCPTPELLCSDDAADMLCSGCMLEGVIDGNESDTFCLYSSTMVPFRAINSLLPTATAEGEEFEVVVRDAPRLCEDGDEPEETTGITCADVAVSRQHYGVECESLMAHYDSAVVEWALNTCQRACSSCSHACLPPDLSDSSGKLLVVPNTGPGCRAAETVRAASGAKVGAVVFSWKYTGPSVRADVPVHHVALPDMERLLVAASAGGAVKVRVRLGPGLATTPAAGVESAGSATPKPRSSFSFTWPVVLCTALIGVLIPLNVGIFVRQRTTAVRFQNGRSIRIPLSIASLGVGVSMLVCITAVTFALVYQTGRETTDTALEEGRAAVELTHAHAVQQVTSLKDQVLTAHAKNTQLGMMGVLQTGKETGLSLARQFYDYNVDDDFGRAAQDMDVFGGGFHVQGVGTGDDKWVFSFRTVSQSFGGRRMQSVVENGTRLTEIHMLGTNDVQYLSTVVFDPMTYFGRQSGLAVDLARGLAGGEHRWHFCDRPQAVSYNYFWQYGVRPLSVLFPMYNLWREYIGVLEGAFSLDSMAEQLLPTVSTEHTSNMTVVVVDHGSGSIVMSTILYRDQRVTEQYTQEWNPSDALTSPMTLETMPVFELNAVYTYLTERARTGARVQGMHEFDQMDWYARSGQQPFQVMKVSFDGGEAVDESPSKWRLRLGGSSSIVGGCRSGRCLDVDGTSSLEVFRNLSTDIPRVRDGRNVTSPAFNPSWNHTRWIGDTEVVHVPDQNPGQAGTPPVQWFPLLREPVLSRQHTVTMWVRPRRSYSEADLDGSFGATLWTDTLSAESAVRITAGGRMIVRGGHGEVCCRTKPLPGGLPAGVWTHIAASLDTWNTRFSMRRQDRPPHELLYAQMCRVFINGSLFSEYPVASSSQEYDLISDNPSPYRVGHGFDGQIDDLQLYNVSLSGSEVRHAMQTGEFRRTAPSREFYSHGSRFAETELDWITLLLLPRDDVMREVERIRRLQTSSSNARREDTDAKLAQRTVETVLATVVIAMGSIAALLLFNEALTKPIGTFARQLLDVAVMKVDGATEERSVIEELDAMYVAMSLVVTNLKEYRQYLPQTLLMEEDDEEESDEEGAEPVHALSLSTTASRSLAGSDHRSSDRRSSDRRSSASHSDVDVFRGSTRSGGRQSFLHQHLHQKSITLCVVNVVGYLGHVRERRTLAVATFHDEYLQEITTRVGSSKGIVDLFVGDRVSVSFNAMRQCGQHRPAAVSAMVYLTAGSGVAKSIKLSGGAATGSALCGSLGTTSLKRFSIIGAVATMAALLERVAVQHSVRLLVDDTLRLDTEEHFTYRLTECVVFPKVSRRLCLMYEARTPAPFTGTGPSDDVDRDEWMYCMDERQARAKALNPWFRYNEAQRTFWGGADARTVLEKLEASTTGRDADVEELEYRDDKEQELKDRLKWAGQDSRAFQPKIVAEVGCPLVDVADSSCRVVDPPIGAWANEVAVVRAPSTPLLH